MKTLFLFSLSLGALISLLFVALFQWSLLGLHSQPPADGGAIIVFLGILTLLAFFLLFRRLSQGFEKFINFYLGSVVIKLLLGGLFIFVVIYRSEENAEVNAVFFMISYLLFTVLEIGFLAGNREKKKA